MTRKSSMLYGGGLWSGLPLTGTVRAALTAAGTTIADALALTGDVNQITTCASGAGAKSPVLAPGDSVVVANEGANALLLYPPTEAITLNGGTAGAAVSVAAGKSALVTGLTAGGYSVLVG